MLLLPTACDILKQGWSLPLPQRIHSQTKISHVSGPQSALSWPFLPAKERSCDPESKTTPWLFGDCWHKSHVQGTLTSQTWWPGVSFSFLVFYFLFISLTSCPPVMIYSPCSLLLFLSYGFSPSALCFCRWHCSLQGEVWPPTRQSILLFPFTLSFTSNVVFESR